MMAWRRPIGRANAISSGHWSSGWKSRVMRSMSCFGSTHIQVITIPKKKVGNFVGRELSPLLANIALHGMEAEVKAAMGKDLNEWYKATGNKGRRDSLRSLTFVRYADDCAPRRREGVHMT